MLIIDELGYVPFSKEGAQLIFQILAERNEQKPVMITTNMEFGDWTQIFGDPSMTAALTDRITHKAHVINCSWESYRLKETLKANKKSEVMEATIYNFLKQRLQTINLQISEENTTWFECYDDNDIHMITDFDGGLLISPCGYEYPLWIDDSSRAAIDYNRHKALELYNDESV